MKLVILCHPPFLASQSMPRFARMLETAYRARGLEVTMLAPRPRLHKLFAGTRFAKWAGYFDQYFLFPFEVRARARNAAPDTLYIFADQALGPWVPLLKDKPHVVHAHDLLNLQSALGVGPGHVTALSGRIYQKYIRRGFKQALHFISVSNKTREDLERFGEVHPVTSDVVYNGLNFPYEPMPREAARARLERAGLPSVGEGVILHVGGGQWYKNRTGLFALYLRYAETQANPLPLWCVGPSPSRNDKRMFEAGSRKAKILFFQNLDNATLQAAYCAADVLLFPSLAEGFGWPLVEAQACGCPVITTDQAPMNEVAGSAARYIAPLRSRSDLSSWADQGARALTQVLARDADTRARIRAEGLKWAARFNADDAIDRYLAIYRKVFAMQSA